MFKGFLEPSSEVYKDLILNIISFIPIGALAGLLIERYRLAKVLLVGLLVSLTIEFSQLIWHRGVFDVDDLFNNTLGAVIGGVFVFETSKLCSLAKARLPHFFVSLRWQAPGQGLKQKVAETANFFYVLVSRDTAWVS